MKTIGLCVPYGKNEATRAALRVIEPLRAAGANVGISSPLNDCQSVHPDWDRYVMRQTFGEFLYWITGVCDRVLWFDIHPQRMIAAKQYNVENVVVPMWRALRSEDLQIVEENCMRAVYCSHEIAKLLREKIELPYMILAPWESGLPRVTRGEKKFWESTKYLITTQGDMSPGQCELVMKVMDFLLERDPSCRVTLYGTKMTFPKRCFGMSERIKKRYGGRVKFEKQGSYYEYAATLANHDWLVCLSSGDNVGITVAEANASGCPVVAFDVPPFCEAIKDGVTGRLIGCDLKFNSLSVPEAVPDLDATLDVMEQIVADPRCLELYRQQIKRTRDPNAFAAACCGAFLD